MLAVRLVPMLVAVVLVLHCSVACPSAQLCCPVLVSAILIAILSLFDLVPLFDIVPWCNEGVRWEGIPVPLCTMRYRQKALELSCSKGGAKKFLLCVGRYRVGVNDFRLFLRRKRWAG